MVAQLRLGAPLCLLPTTLAPMRLLGGLQALAPDWTTAALRSHAAPGRPFYELALLSPELEARRRGGAAAKKER